VFVRKATGLVREIGFLTAILIVVCNVVGLGWQKRAFQYTGPAIVPETEYVLGLAPITMAFILVGIVVLFTVWVFAILGASMPRSGGGYVYISRILSPSVGYVASWMEYFSIAVSYGLIGTAVFEAIMIYAWLAGWGTAWATEENLLIGGIIVVILFAALAAFGVRMAGILLQAIFWIPAAITVVIYGMLLTATPSAMDAGIRSFSGVAPSVITQEAIDLGMAATPTLYWDAVSVAVMGAYWAYIGFAASTFVAGEIKEVAKNLPKTLFIANGFIILLYITFSYLAARASMMVGQVGNYSFFSAYAYLSYHPDMWPGPGKVFLTGLGMGRAWMPSIAAFSAEGLGMGWFLVLVPIFAALWVANDIPPFILTSSRIIFAMAFDRVLPEKLAEVNERWHTPLWAVFITMIVAFVGNFAESNIFPKLLGSDHVLSKFLNDSGGVAATDIWDTLFFLLASVAGLMFVYRRKEIYERSAYKPSIGGFPAITIIGLAATVANIWLFWQELRAWPWDYPEGGMWTAWAFTAILIIVSVIVYFYYKSKGSRIGVDYSTIYAEIPPE